MAQSIRTSALVFLGSLVASVTVGACSSSNSGSAAPDSGASGDDGSAVGPNGSDGAVKSGGDAGSSAGKDGAAQGDASSGGGDGSVAKGDGSVSGDGSGSTAEGGAGDGSVTTADGSMGDGSISTADASTGDGSVSTADGSAGDGATVVDSGIKDATGASDGAQGACTAGTYQCAPGNVVEICNSSGTAWLYSATCTVGCSGGLCAGQCTAGDLRCNANNVEQCNTAGTAWTIQESCSGLCTAGACDLVGLDVTTNQNLDGEIWVDGAVVVHSGATLNSPTGNLTIHASSIVVETGGSIAVAPTGQTAAGTGSAGGYNSYYGTYYNGTGGNYTSGSTVDEYLQPGAPGGVDASGKALGGAGGGVLRLYAGTITVAGQVTANGAAGSVGPVTSSGGGSGGGILLAADSVTVSGSVSAVGGSGGGSGNTAGAGGVGRVKVLYGATHSITGTLTGTVTQALLPPTVITSTSHPDSTLSYNDAFTSLDLSWNKAFPSSQGYYVVLSQTAIAVPTPATGAFIANDFVSFDPSKLGQGANYFHITPVDATSNVGTVEGTFEVIINTHAPALASSSHPDPTQWVNNPNVYFQWSFAQPDASVVGAYYILDQFGDTVPTAADTFLPVSQKQLLLSNIANGISVMHVVSVDTRGNLTKAGASYRVNIGANPGSGAVLGQVVDGKGQPISGASVTINRGLYTQSTNSVGNYNFMAVPAGSFELDVSATGHMPTTKPITVTASGSTTANVSLP
jgi:hypothetical protein